MSPADAVNIRRTAYIDTYVPISVRPIRIPRTGWPRPRH